MKETVKHERLGEITYEESWWTGKKTISINNVPLNKLGRREFTTADGENVTVIGNFLHGASLKIGEETIRVTPPVKWYEIALSVIPLVFIIIWGNSEALCKIVPVIGGFIGGFISAAMGFLGLYVMKSVKPVWAKILIGLGFFAAAFAICCGLAVSFLAVFSGIGF